MTIFLPSLASFSTTSFDSRASTAPSLNASFSDEVSFFFPGEAAVLMEDPFARAQAFKSARSAIAAFHNVDAKITQGFPSIPSINQGMELKLECPPPLSPSSSSSSSFVVVKGQKTARQLPSVEVSIKTKSSFKSKISSSFKSLGNRVKSFKSKLSVKTTSTVSSLSPFAQDPVLVAFASVEPEDHAVVDKEFQHLQQPAVVFRSVGAERKVALPVVSASVLAVEHSVEVCYQGVNSSDLIYTPRASSVHQVVQIQSSVHHVVEQTAQVFELGCAAQVGMELLARESMKTLSPASSALLTPTGINFENYRAAESTQTRLLTETSAIYEDDDFEENEEADRAFIFDSSESFFFDDVDVPSIKMPYEMILEEARIRRATNHLDPASLEFDWSSSSSDGRTLDSNSSHSCSRSASIPDLARVASTPSSTTIASSTSTLGVPTVVVFSPEDSRIYDSTKDTALFGAKRTQSQSNLRSWISKTRRSSKSALAKPTRTELFWNDDELADLRDEVISVDLNSL